jgi:hypothetical protein
MIDLKHKDHLHCNARLLSSAMGDSSLWQRILLFADVMLFVLFQYLTKVGHAYRKFMGLI